MRQFTINCFSKMLKTLLAQGFSFQTFTEFLENQKAKVIILRHDVDKLPGNALKTARLEASLGISGSYYFRTVSCSYSVEIIKEIARLGHEVGYHYETMDTAMQKLKDKSKKIKDKKEERERHIDAAYEDFCANLEKLREFFSIQTICMHGSPCSAYDNKDIWKKYDYRALGIIGEPYFDVDFDKVFYLTDTGRRWNGYKVSVRDKMPQQERWNREGLTFKTTTDIINAAKSGRLPNQIMITVHPQRWSDAAIPWAKELVLQNIKNVVKWAMIRMR